MDRSDPARQDQTVSAAIAGDEPAFAALTERHRRELHVHCYRMLASFDEAEDAVQETFLKAWRGRSGFDGGAQFRAWLYRIATNVCLDMLRHSSRRTAGRSFAEVPWLQPYPDLLLEAAAPSDEQPEAVAIRRETISLAFLAALQVLPPRQRAALIARDVLGWPAAETASALGTSVAAANSALQRARATMQAHLPARRAEWSARDPSAEERQLVEQFIQAHERCDTEAVIAIAARDIRVTMPPAPWVFDGPEALRPLMANAASMGDWRLIPVGRQPAARRGELPAPTGRQRVPRVQARRHAHRGGRDRGDHHVQRGPLRSVRSEAGAVSARPVSDNLSRVLEHVTVTRYVTPLREGGSLPAIVEADNLGTYVMKFRGAGQGPLALVAEIIAGELARRLGLRVPELVLAELDPRIPGSEPDPEIQDLLRASEGLNLGVDFLPSSFGFDPLGWTADRDFASQVLWFDALVHNVDRTWRNPNLLVWHRDIWLIDHGAALYFHHNWPTADPKRPFDAREHVLRGRATALAGAHDALAPRVTEALLQEVTALVPPGWFGDRGAEAYVEHLLLRAPVVPEVIRG